MDFKSLNLVLKPIRSSIKKLNVSVKMVTLAGARSAKIITKLM